MTSHISFFLIFHVIKDMRRAPCDRCGRKLTFQISHVLQIDERSDLALLGIYDAFQRSHPSLQLDGRADLSVGETIYAFGKSGRTNRKRCHLDWFLLACGNPNRNLLQISAPISSGFKRRARRRLAWTSRLCSARSLKEGQI